MGFQEILLHFHPLIALCFIPLVLVIALMSIPYIHYPSSTAGVWFASVKGRRMAVHAAVAASFATSVGIVLDEYVIDFTVWMPGISPIITNGVLSLGIILAGFYGFYVLLKRKYSANRNEVVQVVFVFFLTGFVIFAIAGIWFRGSGMKLVWPWAGV